MLRRRSRGVTESGDQRAWRAAVTWPGRV